MGQDISLGAGTANEELLRPFIGARVVRGPDWKWEEQDGGEGHLGTVREVKDFEEIMVVWDKGIIANYRCHGAYDLKILDSGPAGIKHPNVTCDECKQRPIFGTRWKCSECENYDLCSTCYHEDKHELEHKFFSIDLPERARVLVDARKNSEKISAYGLFLGAQVIRGADWQWGDQNGMSPVHHGKITEIKEWHISNPRSAVSVVWDVGRKNQYRVGFCGKVDIKAVNPAQGYSFYRDHLPVLGKSASCHYPERNITLAIHDKVKVELPLEEVKSLQANHGGWVDDMQEVLSTTGKVAGFSEKNGVIVSYPSGKRWPLNPDILTLHEDEDDASNSDPDSSFEVGDLVQISSDLETVKSLQSGHGEWEDSMILTLGKIGKVKKVLLTGDLRIEVIGAIWTYNPLCVSKVQASQNDPSKELVKAAGKNDLQKVEELLSEGNLQINGTFSGNTALQVASHNGAVEVVELLIRNEADVELEDDDGDRAIHVAALKNQVAVLKVLDQAGADLNARNNNGLSALHLAVNKGHVDFLECLLTLKAHPSLQDSFGDTPLHDAISNQREDMVKLLLESKADISMTNKKGFNCLHHAALKGVTFAVRAMLSMGLDPSVINEKKDDGFTALHLAANNDHVEIAEILISQGNADKDVQNSSLQTPLHLAIQNQSIQIVQLLVKEGASLEVTDNDGDTPLHEAVRLHTFLCLKEVQETAGIGALLMGLGLPDSKKKRSASIACFLVSQGADINSKNNKNQTPLDLSIDRNLSKALGEIHVVHPRVATGNQIANNNAAKVTLDCAGAAGISENAKAAAVSQSYGAGRISENAKAAVVSESSGAAGISEKTKAAAVSKSSGAAGISENAKAAVVSESSGAAGISENAKAAAVFQNARTVMVSKNAGAAEIPESAKAATVSPYAEAAAINPNTRAEAMSSNAGAAGISDDVGAAAPISEYNCIVCSDMPREVMFMPCYHIVTCSQCSLPVKKCLICRGLVTEKIQIEECIVCSDQKSSVLFKPCNHICACDSCAPLMKKCIKCRIPIQATIGYADLCGFNAQKDGPNKSSMDKNVGSDELNKLKQELTDMKDQMICPVCLDRKRNMAFSCGHVTCQFCGDRVRQCPMCRKPILKRVLLF